MRELNAGMWEQDPSQMFDKDLSPIDFTGTTFILTGYFAYGDRSIIKNEIMYLGGKVSNKPLKSGCIVVVGTLPTKDWATNDAGRKLLLALEYREQGLFVRIISEDFFIEQMLEVKKNTPKLIPFSMQAKDYVAMLDLWLKPLCDERQITLCYEKYAYGYCVHPEGKKKEWIFKLYVPRKINASAQSTVAYQIKGQVSKDYSYSKVCPLEIQDYLLS